MSEDEYLPQLRAEKDNIMADFVHASRLLGEEIDKVERGTKYTEVHNDKMLKLAEKVIIPVKEHPKFNFVGKLLGPQGNSLKRLQAETGTKMSILGKGSMRDKKKVGMREEDLRKSGDPKWAHLHDELHVLVEVFAPPPDAYNRMSIAMTELKKFLVPISDFNDEIRAQQMQEMMYINGDENGTSERGRGRGRGAPGPPSRGAPGPGRGGPRGGGGGGGGAPLLATPSPRGGAVRGGPPARGAPPGARGRGGPAGRGAPPAPPPARPAPPAYEEEGYGGSYGAHAGYEEQSYGHGYGESTYNRDPYDQGYGAGGDTQYFDYGHGTGTGREAQYEDYGESWGQSQSMYGKSAAPPVRGKSEYRAHPYAAGGRGAPPPRY